MAGSYNGVAIPADGKKIGYAGGKYDIPDNPIIPFIEGDGIEWEQGTADCARLIEFLNKDMLKSGKKQIRLDSGVGIKPMSVSGTKRLVRMAIQHALESGRKTVTLVHKGNIQKFTEGAFRKWGYEIAVQELRDQIVTERESWIVDNKAKNPNLTVAQKAGMVEPGLEFAPPEFGKSVAN